MTSEEKIRSYIPMVDFIAEIAGPNTEVVLHDVREKERSLVAIRNGLLSGRDVGAAMTDFASHILKRGKLEGRDYITNYLGKAGSNGKFLKSSTFFIRGEDGEIIGILGINTDLSAFSEVYRILSHFLNVDENGEEIFSSALDDRDADGFSIKEMVFAVIEQVVNSYAVDTARMTTEEKKEIVDLLNEKGVFLLKGSVTEVAGRLDVSEQTIYRYLK